MRYDPWFLAGCASLVFGREGCVQLLYSWISRFISELSGAGRPACEVFPVLLIEHEVLHLRWLCVVRANDAAPAWLAEILLRNNSG